MSEIVLVTGANGFIGSALAEDLTKRGVVVRRAIRAAKEDICASVAVGDISGETDWSRALCGVEKVIHTAARVHVMADRANDALSLYRQVNVDGTLALAKKAAELGVKRFVFISSIKVNGESTDLRGPFLADESTFPSDPYGISKKEAETLLNEFALRSEMEVVIVRPPLVYGSGVKANFLKMMRLVAEGVPLPFGAVSNLRSMVALENLTDFIYTCLSHERAANQTFMVSDGEDISTGELLRRLGEALGRPARLFNVPMPLLKGAASITGRLAIYQRLCGSLQVDISKNLALLNWVPPVPMRSALASTANQFIKGEKLSA